MSCLSFREISRIRQSLLLLIISSSYTLFYPTLFYSILFYSILLSLFLPSSHSFTTVCRHMDHPVQGLRAHPASDLPPCWCCHLHVQLCNHQKCAMRSHALLLQLFHPHHHVLVLHPAGMNISDGLLVFRRLFSCLSMLSMCVLTLTGPLRSIDLALSSTLFSIYIPYRHHTNKDTSFYIIQIPHIGP